MHLFKFIPFLFSLSVFFVMITTSCKTKKSNDNSTVIHQDSLANYPYCIAMMNDPKTNYYQAVAAFEKYWEHREKPTEDNGEGKDIFEKDKSPEEKQKEANRSVEYVYEYKQFLHWKETNKNYVKPDGTIMTSEEVLEQWKKNNQR
jgi:hypothetical protein